MTLDVDGYIASISPYVEWTDEEDKLFAALSRKAVLRNGWVPQQTLHWHHRLVNKYACELVVMQGTKILLCTYRSPGIPEYKGLLHIPGGYTWPDEELSDTCIRVAKRELGVPVRMIGVLDVKKWPKGMHPWGGRPLSAFTLCELDGDFVEDAERRFHEVDVLPAHTLPIHAQWIREHFIK